MVANFFLVHYNQLPSGKRLNNYGKIHSFYSWVNQLFRLGHGFNSKLLVYRVGPGGWQMS